MENGEDIIGELKSGGRTEKELKYGGYLSLDHDIPFLIIYRSVPNDSHTARLARAGASYLILSEDHFEYFQDLITRLIEKMDKRFRAFIFIEIYTGPRDNSEFVIRGPSHKLSVSLKVLREELENIKSYKQDETFLGVRVEHTKDRLNSERKVFFSIEEFKNYGCTFIGLEVPPVYRNEQGEVYPVYFKQFRNQFIEAVHKSVLEFIRVQTSSELASYEALGKRNIHDKLFEIDKGLTEIENAYPFLLLIAPVNMQTIRKRFFESNFEKVEPYNYRLLPIDPDLQKRKLYNLRIDEIDDPALAFLFEEKREQIDQELTMLKERGTNNFFYGSLRLYKGIRKKLLHEAQLILENIPENTDQQKGKERDAGDFSELAKNEFDYFREQVSDFSSNVHIRDDVNIIMVSGGELYLPSDYTMTQEEAAGIVQHEIGTHALTYYNGSQQPLTQLSQGLANYESLQEGMAVLSEYLVGSLTGNRLRHMAGRVIGGQALLDNADFKEVFNLLHSTYGFSKAPAFNITSRVFQGGGFLKDIVYLRGMADLRDYFHHKGGLEILWSGKFALEHVPLIKSLTEREVLKPARLKPRYLETKGFEKRMNKLREGIALSKLVS